MHKYACLTLLTIICSSNAAAELFYQPKIGLEYINYELQVGGAHKPATATIPTINLGLSIISTTTWYFDFDLAFGQGEVSNFYPEDDYIDHGSLTMSMGKSIGDGYTVYGGFNNASRLIRNKKDQANQGDSAEFNSEGLFLGLAKSYSLNEKSLISLTAAIGSMEGTYRLNNPQGQGSNNVKGDAIGYSGSAAYVYKTSESTSFTAGLKAQSYTYTDMADTYTGETFSDTEESIFNLFAKASHTF